LPRRFRIDCLWLVLVISAGCTLASNPAELTPTLPPPTVTSTVTTALTETPTTTPTLAPTFTPMPLPTSTPLAGASAYVSAGVRGLRLQTSPGTAGEAIFGLEEFTALTIIGRTGDNKWLQVITSQNSTGWLQAEFLDVFIDLEGVAVTDEVTNVEVGTPPTPAGPDGQVAASAGGLRLRASPSTDSFVVANLNALTPLSIIGRTEDNGWLQVTTNRGESGWVIASYIDAFIDLDAVQSVTEEKGGIVPIAPVVSSSSLTGEVLEIGDGLRVRAGPGISSAIVTNLDKFTTLTIVGRTADSSWVQVNTPGGASGWVLAAYLSIRSDLNAVPVTGQAEPTAAAPPVMVGISGISGKSREIYLRGQQLGNRANVFSKVGDSLTVATYVLYPFAWGTYNLHEYAYLQSAINFFSVTNAREGNSFANISLAADNGWTTVSVLTPERANPSVCQPGEIPLVCEYRVVRPAVALILFGTNDVSAISAGDFGANLANIVDISIDMGVIPVLTTSPTRAGFDGQVNEFNQIVIGTARGYDVPLLDYASVMRNAPNGGLSEDNVHPSWPPGDYSAAADLSAENLRYGYAIRNLMALQMLDALRQQVLY
jgi:uncharacterized protein YgiM (DUF1202 family)